MASVMTDKIISAGSSLNAKYLVLIKRVSSISSVLARIGIHAAFFSAFDDLLESLFVLVLSSKSEASG